MIISNTIISVRYECLITFYDVRTKNNIELDYEI